MQTYKLNSFERYQQRSTFILGSTDDTHTVYNKARWNYNSIQVSFANMFTSY